MGKSQVRTVESINENIEALLKYSDEDLKAFPAKVLLHKLRLAGASYFLRDGKTTSTSLASKDELIQTLKKVTERKVIQTSAVELIENYREAALIDVETRTDLGSKGNYFFELIRKSTLASWNVDTQKFNPPSGDLYKIGIEVTAYITSLTGLEGYTAAASTKLNYSTKLRKIALQLAHTGLIHEDWMLNRVIEDIETVWSLVRAGNKQLAIEKKDADKAQLSSRQQTLEEVNIDSLLTKAVDLLEKLDFDNPVKGHWKDVSIALALTTGRRQSEIHFSGSFREGENDHELIFVGQLKGKSLADKISTEMSIPTLIPTHLILKGIVWLHLVERRYESPLMVNNVCAKPLGLQTKEKWGSAISLPKIKYHGLRQLYAQAATKNFCPKTLHESVYKGRILGHGIDDQTTPERYNSDYRLVTECVGLI